MPDRITRRDLDGRPVTMRCSCGALIHMTDCRPGADVGCSRCGLEYNSAGQMLAGRSQ
jgi:hypothetical protein